MSRTRAIRIAEHGGPEVLRMVDLDLAEPGPGEARVRHTAVGLNFIDVYHRTGLYPVPLPSGLGHEAAGVVEAVGPGVTDLKVGERVAYGIGPLGSYSERRVMPADILVPLPGGIDDRQAAAMMVQGLTAWYLLHETYKVTAGETVVVHAAAGGVGLILCQWARALGVEVIGVVGSDAKAELARANGCAHTIVAPREDVAARVRALTGGAGVPVVYDSVGRDTFAASLDCLRPRGLMVSYGNASGPPAPLTLGVLAQKGSLYVTRPTLGSYVTPRSELLRAAAALFGIVATGQVRIQVNQVFDLADAAEAHRALEARRTTGSTVLLP